MPSLADAPAEAIDGRTLRYLLKANLARKKYEEEEEEKKYQERAAETGGGRRLSWITQPLFQRGRGRRRGRKNFLAVDVDVPVIFSDKFQQLFEFFVFLDRMVDIPVVLQRQVPTVFFSVLVQFLDKVVVPVLRNDRDMVRQCRKPCWCRSCSSSKVDIPSCRRGKSSWSCLFRKP